MTFCVSSVLVCLCVFTPHGGLSELLPYHDLTVNTEDGDVALTFDHASVRIPRDIYKETMEPIYNDMWKEILFPENESIHHVELFNSYDYTGPAGSNCIYIPDDHVDYHNISGDETTTNYHCARGHSQPCLNNGVCDNRDCRPPGGICNCNNTDGFEGVNCGIKTANVDGLGCPVGCVHGTCVSDGVSAHCECEPGYAGDLCDKKAYYHECTPTGFSVCITPFSVDTFWGDIYVKDRKLVPGCSLWKVPDPPLIDNGVVDWCRGYGAVVNFNSPCGTLGPISDDNMTSFELQLKVQYAKDIVTCTDETVTLICQYNRQSLLMYKTVLLNTGGSHGVQREIEYFSPVVITMTTQDGRHLYPPVPVGLKVDVCFFISHVTGFRGLVINNVVMNNTRAGEDYREITIYDEGCVSSSLSSVVNLSPHWVTPGDKSRVCFQFKIFFFDRDLNLTYPTLGLVADISVFTDPADAILATCGSRRKRQASGGEKETIVGTKISITIPEDLSDTEIPSIADGPNRPWLIPVLSAVGIVAGISLAVLLLVAYTGRSRRDMKQAP